MRREILRFLKLFWYYQHTFGWLQKSAIAVITNYFAEYCICSMQNTEVCSCLSSRSWIRSLIYKWQGNQDIALDSERNGASIAPNTSTLWQQDSNRHCEWHREKAQITVNGNALFLGYWSSTQIFWRKLDRLILKASFRGASQKGTFVVYSHPEFTQGTPTSASTKCSERVCWNPRTRVL